MAQKTKQQPRKRRNLLPDEYKRRGHVAIEMDEMQAMLFAPDKLQTLHQQRPGHFLEARAAVIEEIYIVTVHRMDGVWEYVVQHDGETFRLPGQVVDRILSYRQSIIKEQRRARGQERFRRIAQEDQAEALEQELDGFHQEHAHSRRTNGSVATKEDE